MYSRFTCIHAAANTTSSTAHAKGSICVACDSWIRGMVYGGILGARDDGERESKNVLPKKINQEPLKEPFLHYIRSHCLLLFACPEVCTESDQMSISI